MLGIAVTRYFRRKGWTVNELSRAEFDIARQPAEALVPHLKDVTVVVNCAGVVKPRIAATPIEDVLKVNSVFPRNLALLSKKMGINVFISPQIAFIRDTKAIIPKKTFLTPKIFTDSANAPAKPATA
jgi:dTDP-4-dehydrorhamnose reductase